MIWGMIDKASFALYVYRDGGRALRIDSFDKVLDHSEAIDIENDKYLFWGATGQRLKSSLTRERLPVLKNADNNVTLQEALEKNSLGNSKNAEQSLIQHTTGTAEQIWAKLERAEQTLPRRGLISRLLCGKANEQSADYRN
jgi:hypothetical protein